MNANTLDSRSQSFTRRVFFLILGLNILLKMLFLFLNTIPSDVVFYESTGWFLLHDVLPYQSFDPSSRYFQITWSADHPNGPLNYLFYAAIIALLGNSVIAIKLPWLIAEIIISIYIYKIGLLISTQKKALIAMLFYTLCMPSYYTGILTGCDELITGAFAIMALYYFLTKKELLAGVLLALGISYKLYPIFFLPAIMLYAKKNGEFAAFLRLCVMVLLTYVIVALPYLLICPEEFIEYNFGQVNRLITISYGHYIQYSWFYQPIFTVGGFLSITPHLLFEALIMGGFFLRDLTHLQPNKKYSTTELFRACTYYVAMLPIISLSYNYRYLQWVLPLLVLYLLPKFQFYSFQNKNQRDRAAASQYFRKIGALIVFSICCTLLIFGVNIYQYHTNSPKLNPFGVLAYFNYASTFFIIFTGYLLVSLALFWKNSWIRQLSIFTYLQGVAGLALYYSFDGRNYYMAHEYPFLILSLICLGLSYFQLGYLVLGEELREKREQ